MANFVKLALLGWQAPRDTFCGDYETHIRNMEAYLARQLVDVLPDQPDLILLPEACDRYPAFPIEIRKRYYRERGDRIRDYFSRIARENHCYIAYSSCRYLADGSPLPYRNCTQILGRDGSLVGAYNKNHLVPDELDVWEVAYGTEAPVFTLDFGRVACAICFDLNYTELLQRYAVQKPDLILFSSMYHGGFVQRDWAYHCRAYFAGAICGEQCRVLNPFGEQLFASTNYQPYITGRINLDYMLVHIDENMPAVHAAKRKYGDKLTVHDPGYIGALLLTYEGTDRTVRDIVREFGIIPLDDYFDRCRAHRAAHI